MTELLPDKTAGLPPGDAGVIRRILIVDDSPAHLRLAGQVLRRQGFDVAEARSGPVALDILAGGGIDLVLSDWVMPGMSGLELCRTFRETVQGPYVYFILLTSKSTRTDVATGLAAGADDFLSKPINTEELRARITAGGRLVAIQRTLEAKNAQLGETLGELQTLYDSLARDLVEARRLQQALVPDRDRSYPGAEVSLLLRPSGHVGGDLVGAFRVSDTRLGIYSIDVSGHGIASALMTARLASYLSGSAPEHNIALAPGADGVPEMLPVDQVCRALNKVILDDLDTELYFTMALAEIDVSTGEVWLAQAGHPHPLILRGSGVAEFVGGGGMPVGLFEDADFERAHLRLSPGDRLILYSDGFTEAEDPGGQMLDQDGLSRLVRAARDLSGREFVDMLLWRLTEFMGDAEFADDVSGVILEFAGAGSDQS